MKNKVKKFLKIAGIGGGIVILAILIYSFAVIQNARTYTVSTILPDIKASRWRPFLGEPRPFSIRKDDLPDPYIAILVKVQDPGFYSHNGVDLSTPGAGLTTISQAIVKKLYFKKFKSGFRKLKQSLIARFVVNEMISKDDQISIFLNAMYLGEIKGKAQIGFHDAAQGFFRKGAKDLSKDEFISLVAAIVSPNTFNLLEHPEWNKLRSDRIRKLETGEYIPKGLMDQYYGKLPKEIVDAGLPTCSYFPSLYENE